MSNYLETLEAVASGVVAAHAIEVDQAGAFPHTVDRCSAGRRPARPDQQQRGWRDGRRSARRRSVVERLARECGSTAMIVCMHYSARR